MSIVWTLIATFLYLEIAVVLVLVLPIVSPQRWQRFFRSRFLQMIHRQASVYFYMLLLVLVLFVLEAIREMRKYSNIEVSSERLDLGMQHSVRLFRAQRNFYISGFAIFLVLVIRRLILLISDQASLVAQSQASMGQAKSATLAARTLMSRQQEHEQAVANEESNSGDALAEKQQAEQLLRLKIDELRTKLDTLSAELVRERKDKEALKSQAESLNREYDRLTEEYSKLERRVLLTNGSKDD